MDIRLVAEGPLGGARGMRLVRDFIASPDHKVFAMAGKRTYRVADRPSRAEAVRMALEGCTEFYHAPCLIVSVDGFLTTQLPKTREIADIFLPSIDAEIPQKDRARIVDIYLQNEWRALVRGKNAWHPVAGAVSESEAIAAAQRSCEQTDVECRLHAIGNFRVSDSNSKPTAQPKGPPEEGGGVE